MKSRHHDGQDPDPQLLGSLASIKEEKRPLEVTSKLCSQNPMQITSAFAVELLLHG